MEGQRHAELIGILVVVAITGILFVVFAAASVGLWAWLLVGAVGLLFFGLLAWRVANRHRHPPASVAPRSATAPRDPSVRRVLVVADESCGPESLRAAIGEHAAGRPAEVLVIAPALSSRLDRWTGDQRAYDAATERLDAVVGALTETGLVVHGRVGPHDPIQAVDDGLREFRADEIVLAVHGGSTANWLEEGVVEIARGRYDVPVTAIVVDGNE
jgi:hypothetical protein